MGLKQIISKLFGKSQAAPVFERSEPEGTPDIGQTTDLEHTIYTVEKLGECDLRFSALPPLPKNGMYFKEGETRRYWADLKGSGDDVYRDYFKTPLNVNPGDKVTYSYDHKGNITLKPKYE